MGIKRDRLKKVRRLALDVRENGHVPGLNDPTNTTECDLWFKKELILSALTELKSPYIFKIKYKCG